MRLGLMGSAVLATALLTSSAISKAAPPAMYAKNKEVKEEKEACKPNGANEKAHTVAQHLQDISVTIVSKNNKGSGEGSGVVKTRKNAKGETVNFVWTAAHVIDNLRKTRTVIDPKSGTPKVIVEFDDALVVKSIIENGRKVGKIEFDAEVIRYNAEEDLAILRIRKKSLIQCSVKMYLDDDIPAVGTELLHVGSLLGQLGSNSMTKGIMSQHGRIVDKKIFDQTTVTAFPGSSGGGVYLTDGRLVGLLLRGAGETFNLIAPARRMKEWAERAQVEWAFDDSVPMPSEAEMKKLPVEDNGVTFSYSVRAEAKDKDKTGVKTMLLDRGKAYHLGTLENEMKFPTYLYWKAKETPVNEGGY